mgnify:CR=1 FL=1
MVEPLIISLQETHDPVTPSLTPAEPKYQSSNRKVFTDNVLLQVTSPVKPASVP